MGTGYEAATETELEGGPKRFSQAERITNLDP